ncbi:MAG: hypothetical protein EPN26_07010 [Rhodospirillales bacterium]|nr:MAG: hypothetical protein EPN26_07010 [Rhodospirillales bacterium]
MRRRIMSWTGLVLLAFNLIAGTLMPVQAADPLGQSVQDVLEGRGLICTTLGLKAVGPDGGLALPGAESESAGLCVFCLPLMQGGLDQPPSLVLTDRLYPASDLKFQQIVQAFPPTLEGYRQAAPRAPPVL